MNKTIHELNSLSQAELTDELIIYDVSEGESKKIQVQNLVGNPNYSTDETFTGQYWIDGKPIYRKVVTGLSFSLSNNSFTTISLQNEIGFFISCKVISDGSLTFTMTEYQAISSSQIKVSTALGGGRTGKGLILEYTKAS